MVASPVRNSSAPHWHSTCICHSCSTASNDKTGRCETYWQGSLSPQPLPLTLYSWTKVTLMGVLESPSPALPQNLAKQVMFLHWALREPSFDPSSIPRLCTPIPATCVFLAWVSVATQKIPGAVCFWTFVGLLCFWPAFAWKGHKAWESLQET